MTADPVLRVRDLVTEFAAAGGSVRAVDGVSFDLHAGETTAIVGESGSGKSVTALSIMRLLPRQSARVVAGQILFDGHDLVTAPSSFLRRVRGRHIAMVFQDPMAYLNPTMSIGAQLVEAIRAHDADVDKAAARDRAISLLQLVGVPRPHACVRQHPHQYSGGMLQRVMIAMAISNRPRLLIADEPTTALDVTVQAQVVEVLTTVQAEIGMSILLITHDLGLAGEIARSVLVMYGGRIVETSSIDLLFERQGHPYTAGLMASLPDLDRRVGRLATIPGQPTTRYGDVDGCVFRPRCRLGTDRARCADETPELVLIGAGHRSACHFSDEVAGPTATPPLPGGAP